MFTIKPLRSYIEEDQSHYGSFIIEPLEAGHSLTIANILRRTLLSEIIGTAITSIRINNITHEFEAIKGVREDILDILLNLKEIRFSNTKYCPTTIQLKVTGPSIVTAAQLITPKHIQVINPTQYIATVNSSSTLEMELVLEQGRGYCFAHQVSNAQKDDKFIMVDAIFSPIKRVNYRVQIFPTEGNELKESLIFEIWTDGSITPLRSLKEATKFLIKIFSHILTIT